MRLAVRNVFGRRPGDTPVRGQVQASGLELERHKPYDEGDELRYLDWNAYARLDQMLVRQFRAEREAPVHVFVDGSASMASPPQDRKFEFAIGLALSLAYVAVRHHNPVRIVCLQRRSEGEHDAAAGDYGASPLIRFPALVQRLADFCARVAPHGDTVLESGIQAYAQSHAVPGLAVVISDFLIEQGAARSLLHGLLGRGYEVAALRPIGAAERDPSRVFQRARVRDVETGREKFVRLSPANLALYQQAVGEHLGQLERDCADNASLFSTCDIEAGLEHCVFGQLPRVGLLH